jgi:hypothetical protein
MTSAPDIKADREAMWQALAAVDEARRALLARLGGVVEADAPRQQRRGGVSSRQSKLLADRNEMLCRLRFLIKGWDRLSASELAREIEAAAMRYEASRWPIERLWAGPPQAEPAATFWTILQKWARLPRKKQLIRILSVDIQ